jgi:hypothetical protein
MRIGGSDMMVTARQLAEMHKAAGGKGPIVLPYRARLTPLAADWVRSAKVSIGYGEASASVEEKKAVSSTVGEYLWWCDGPCGAAKAAITMEAKQTPMRSIDPPSAGCPLTAALKIMAAEVKAGNALGGLLMVESGGAAVVLANRSVSLRAIVGTSIAAVDQGLNQIAANVLVIEHPRLSLAQVRNLVSRFVRAKRELSEEARRSLTELASCG